MKKNIIIAVLLGLIVVYILFRLAVNYMVGQDYLVVSEKISPDGVYTLFEIDSLSEGGYAPYGQHLVLSTKNSIRQPAEGYVVFAGYCQRPFEYMWLTDKNIQIVCTSNEQVVIRTKAEMAYGINVEVLLK